MTGKIDSFDLKVDGGYRMSLFYASSETEFHGKTPENEDRFTAHFVQLMPYKRIVQTITFDSDNPIFSGEMNMEVTYYEQKIRSLLKRTISS